MGTLTADGRERLGDIARRHGVSDDAAQTMLAALVQGGGTMAQFNHAEFGGGGQWMQGGMTMISDLFNTALKANVDSLCRDLAALLLTPPPGTWQEDTASAPAWAGGGAWWPPGLGAPNASGGQNDLRYAYFADAGRLAIENAGVLTVYDTADHRISGVSQQQGNGWTLTFTSQYGTVPVTALRVVDGGALHSEAGGSPDNVPEPPPPTPAPARDQGDGFADTVWRFAAADAAAAGTLTLLANGAIAGGDDERARYWSAENGTLIFYDADGRSSVCFTIPGTAGSDPSLHGHDPAAPQRTYTLRPPASRNETPPAPSPRPALPLDVTAGGWTLEDANGNRLAGLRLLAEGRNDDGRIDGGRATEALWRIADDSLILLHGSGRPTARFDTFQFRAGRWTLLGASSSDPTAALFLKQS